MTASAYRIAALGGLVCACCTAVSSDSPATARAHRERVEDVFLLSGELRALESAPIRTPRVDGVASIQWLAEDGATVESGELVAQFDSGGIQASLEQHRASLRQAQIQLESRERELRAEREAKRAAAEAAEVEAEKARVDAGVPRELRPAVEWDRLQIALLEKEAALEKARLDLTALAETSEADLQVLRSAVQKARRQLASAEATLDAVSIAAPRDGIFVVADHFRGEEDRKYAAGDTVFTGLTIATIPDLAEMEVVAELHDVDFGRVTAGMPARVVLDTYPDEVIPGRVVEVVAVANPTRFRSAFPVRVSLERVDPERMRPGMSVRVEVVRRTWPDALVVPRGAVRLEGTRATVAAGGSARGIRIESCTLTLCVIESGLEEGELVDVS